MNRSQARVRLLEDIRQVIAAGGDAEVAARRLRVEGFSEAEIRKTVGRGSSASRWRTRGEGVVLLGLTGVGLLAFASLASTHGGLGAMNCWYHGFANHAFGILLISLAAGVALSKILFGR